MARSPVPTPVRSISLPSRLQAKPKRIETELSMLRAFESPSKATTCLAAGGIQFGLTRLVELYNCIEEVVQSPETQQALHQQQHVKLIEETLDGSIRLIDACGTIRDLISMLKEQVQFLQSALRRRGLISSIESAIHAYISFRKKSKKGIVKGLKALKRMESNVASFLQLDVDQHLLMVVNVLREASALTIYIFESLLQFLSMPVGKAKAGRWSLLRKLFPITAERDQKMFNEVGSVDIALCSLHERIRGSDAKVDVQMALKRLRTLDCSVKSLEDGLDCLSRRLIQHRVCLLNILTP